RGIGKTHQPQHYGVATHDIQLIRFRYLQNHRLAVTRVHEVDSGIGACERVLAHVRFGNQSYTSIVAEARLLHFYELSDFRVRSIQGFELLDVAGPHPCLIERTIIREQMLIASTDPQEHRSDEK